MLTDLAEEARSLEEFQHEAGKLFAGDSTAAAGWELAREAQRTATEIDQPFDGLPRMEPRASALRVELVTEHAAMPFKAMVEEPPRLAA